MYRIEEHVEKGERWWGGGGAMTGERREMYKLTGGREVWGNLQLTRKGLHEDLHGCIVLFVDRV